VREIEFTGCVYKVQERQGDAVKIVMGIFGSTQER
jgi:hypothetical protein